LPGISFLGQQFQCRFQNYFGQGLEELFHDENRPVFDWQLNRSSFLMQLAMTGRTKTSLRSE
jgi:hypothetical protein